LVTSGAAVPGIGVPTTIGLPDESTVISGVLIRASSLTVT
jgi:hypothetical protein